MSGLTDVRQHGSNARRGALSAMLLATILAITVGAANSDADQMTVFTCHDPAGNAVGNDGWTILRTSDNDMVAANSCAGDGAGAMELELAANPSGYSNGAGIEWSFSAPSWASIASYDLQVAGSYAIGGTGASGVGQAFIDAPDESDPIYDYRNLGAGPVGASAVNRTPPDPVSGIVVNASCDGQDGPCPSAVPISHIDISSATLVLDDSTTPTVSDMSGSLVSGATLRGSAEVDFNAADSGPGVYSGQLIVDGQPQPAVILNTNNGWCQNLGQTNDGTRSFAHPEPCAQSTSGSLTLDTASLPDGQHTLKLVVDDASGDATTAYDGTITTNNAPANTQPPTILPGGQASIGATLTAEAGSWSAPEGAGAISYRYQWQDCDTQGENCQTIPGAESASYTAAATDVGHTLRVLVTAVDNDGGTAAASAPGSPVPSPPDSATVSDVTDAITPTLGTPNGTPASEDAQLHLAGPSTISRPFTSRAFTLTGQLIDSTGTAIVGATLEICEQAQGTNSSVVIGRAATAANGSFTIHVPAGPSRTITLGYRARSSDPDYSAQASVSETVDAGVQLHIAPHRTTPNGTISITGQLAGPIPHGGVLVELLVHYRGQWVPFRTPRASPSGRFKALYQFQGATGRFPFRALAPARQVGFPYASGYSNTITVRSA